MKEFFFKLFRLEYEKEECSSCDRLMLLLEEEKRLNKRLIDELMPRKEAETRIITEQEFKPLMPKNSSWASTRAKLESEDRMQADRARKENAVKILEKELGVEDASEVSEAI